jgi:hypothetical protein
MLANIGEIRAMQPGIEVAQGEDIADCSQYLNELRRNQDKSRIEQRIDPQNLLEIETRTKQIEQRMKLCEQSKKINAYAVNVKAQGDEAKPTGKANEWIDAALSRANLIALDRVGASPNEMEMDERIEVKEEDLKGDVTVWDKEGGNPKKIKMSNAEQLNRYNRQLASAETGLNRVIQGSNTRRGSPNILKRFGIARGSINAVKLNDMTPDMSEQMKKGGFSGPSGDNHPGDRLEMAPDQLVSKGK